MKNILKLVFLLMPLGVMAQSIVKITPSMFDAATDQQFLSATDGWLFRAGNDTAWADKNIDIAGWQKLKPAELSAKYADKNGRLECWFRIKLKLDRAFGTKQFGIKYSAWAAADLYVDGRLISSYGNTGRNGAPYREFTPYNNPDFPANLKPGTEYTIAIHLVDYVAFFPPDKLKSQNGMASSLRITGPRYNEIFILQDKENSIYTTVWVSVSGLLAFLFWFLSIQNPLEKNLRLIAIGTTSLVLAMCCVEAYKGEAMISYNRRMLYLELSNFFIAGSSTTSLFIVAGIFRKRVARAVKLFIIVGLIFSIPSDLLPPLGADIYSLIFFGGIFAICIYYNATSWKTLKGAQWAIVAGLLLSLTFAVLFIVLNNIIGKNSSSYSYLLVSGYSLAFPLFLMVYVAMRFGEIVKEVRQNAAEVVRLSEEKKDDALNRQKILEEEVNRQTAEIRSNQARLIQSEKMASLGELTAGIAHEIQNPLNFVNNFSEVSAELLDEMDEELDKGDIAEAKSIAADLKQNLEKINHHGKRADFIVKGMLQHSRTSTGERELTNINTLADEFLKLSYHGLRAKDKSFNADLITYFDENLPKISIVQQDIGRVLLNLFNNAFYAVNEKKKAAGDNYKPEVTVSTSSTGKGIEIRVKDNGNGIPDALKDKIMQPFFTTKPTGEGTGLGLSLSYDIVVKGHGGSISVDSREGEGAEFVINILI